MVPTQLAGCVTWLRADLGVTLSLGNVTTWADQSGKGNDAVAPGGREPPYNVAGHQIGGQPTLFFDPTGGAGTEKLLQLPPGAFGALTAMHAFVVHRRVAATESIASRTGFWHIGTDNTTAETMPGTDLHVRDGAASLVTYDTGTPPKVPLNQSQVYEVQATSGSWSNALNGIPQGSSVTNTPAFYATPLLGGNTQVVPFNFYYGDWAEVIVFNRILSVSERGLLINYLNGRYGLGAK